MGPRAEPNDVDRHAGQGSGGHANAMTRRSDIGTAVIGSGFIGTVHIEALRRIGVNVLGLLESSPELGAQRAAAVGLPRSYDSLEELLADDAVQVVLVTSPRATTTRTGQSVPSPLGRHVVREEAAGDDVDGVGELVGLAAASGLVNAVNFNIRFYPLNQHVAALVREGGLGDVRLVTGRYFQDWLLYDTDWNWRLEKGRGGALRAVGDIGSHWLDLATFLTGRRVRRSWRSPSLIPVRHSPAVPHLLDERAGDTIP